MKKRDVKKVIDWLRDKKSHEYFMAQLTEAKA